jgi:hypothetical protein
MSNITTARTLLLTAIAVSVPGALADEAGGFYQGAGAGFIQPPALDAPTPPTPDTTSAFGGYRFNSRFGVEGFYADTDREVLPSDTDGNIYTHSLLGQLGANDATVAGVSAIATLVDSGQFRPFARLGMHHYELSDSAATGAQGNSLLIGAGAELDLSQRWRARFEWERYTGVKSLDPDVFSARFEYKF